MSRSRGGRRNENIVLSNLERSFVIFRLSNAFGNARTIRTFGRQSSNDDRLYKIEVGRGEVKHARGNTFTI